MICPQTRIYTQVNPVKCVELVSVTGGRTYSQALLDKAENSHTGIKSYYVTKLWMQVRKSFGNLQPNKRSLMSLSLLCRLPAAEV